jgi:hypothetical protein
LSTWECKQSNIFTVRTIPYLVSIARFNSQGSEVSILRRDLGVGVQSTTVCTHTCRISHHRKILQMKSHLQLLRLARYGFVLAREVGKHTENRNVCVDIPARVSQSLCDTLPLGSMFVRF